MKIIKSLAVLFYTLLFNKNKFYYTIDIGSIVFKIWERPGKWLKGKGLHQLINDIHTISLAGQGDKGALEYGVAKGHKDDLDNRLITIAYDKNTGEPIGFAAQIYMDVPVKSKIVEVLHLGFVCISQKYQKKSFVGLLYILPNLYVLIKRRFRPIWVSNVTQVPCIVGIVAQHYEAVYPNPLRETLKTETHKLLFEGIMAHHRSAFGTGEEATIDVEKQIIFNSYTGGSDNLKKTFEETAKYRNEVVNTFCQTHLDYARGDDFVQIGKLSKSLVHQYCRQKFAGFNLKWLSYLTIAGVFTAISTPIRVFRLFTEGVSYYLNEPKNTFSF